MDAPHELPEWARALKWAAWALAFGAIMAWVSRSRHKRRGSVPTNTLAFPHSMLIIGIVCAVFFAGLEIATVILAPEITSIFTHAFLLALTLLGLYLTAEYFMTRIEVDDPGFWFRRFYGAIGAIRWDEVTDLRYSSSMKWFRVESADGTVFRVSAQLTGLPVFAQAALANLPPNVIAPDAMDLLRETAAGKLPGLR